MYEPDSQASPQPLEELEVGQAPADDEEPAEPTTRRSLWGIVLIALIVLLLIIIIWLLRSCGDANDSLTKSRGNQIESVEGSEPIDGAISLWLTEDADVNNVLAAAGVVARETTDLGAGRWVIELAGPANAQALQKLADQEGVYDAGLVYER